MSRLEIEARLGGRAVTLGEGGRDYYKYVPQADLCYLLTIARAAENARSEVRTFLERYEQGRIQDVSPYTLNTIRRLDAALNPKPESEDEA